MMKKKKKYSIATIILIIALHAFGIFAKYVYNKFLDEAHLMHIAHGRVETEMQRRHDVVTRCIDAVRQHMKIEGEIQGHLITLNGLIEKKANKVDQLKVEQEIIKLLAQANILRESYPELKSANPYLAVMKNIQHAGGRVTRERLNLNERIYEYNMMLRIFPLNIFAVLYRYDVEPFFEAPAGSLKVPSFKELYNRNSI